MGTWLKPTARGHPCKRLFSAIAGARSWIDPLLLLFNAAQTGLNNRCAWITDLLPSIWPWLVLGPDRWGRLYPGGGV